MIYVDRITKKLSNIKSISSISLFGSRADNSSKERSDYDLCILVDNYEDKDVIMKNIVDLMNQDNILIHPYIFTNEEFEERKELSIYRKAFEKYLELYKR